jgi:hypothetical protein
MLHQDNIQNFLVPHLLRYKQTKQGITAKEIAVDPILY